MPRPILILIAVLAAITPCVNAQRMGSSFHGSNHGGLNQGGFSQGRFRTAFDRSTYPGSFLYPLAFSDPLYSDYLYSTGYPVASQPPVIFLQAAPAASASERFSSSMQTAPTQPLMIELQGDRYVRVSGEDTSGAEMIGPATINQIAQSAGQRKERSDSAIHPPAPPQLAPAVLVFRDGHREEVSGYTIANGVLYASADYYTSGSWNKKIELASLNLPETIQSNQSRGVRFQIPTASNEIIVGP
jgi:hypothetical protein